MERKIVIREAREEDATQMLHFLEQVAGETDFLTFGPGELQLTSEQQEAFIKSCQETENQRMLLAFDGDHVVGNLTFRGGLRKRTQHTGEFGVSVLKSYWGQGIGRRLLLELLEWAGKNPVIRKVNLLVRSDNQRGIELYKKLGFEEEGCITREFYIDGIFHDAISMGKCFDEPSEKERR